MDQNSSQTEDHLKCPLCLFGFTRPRSLPVCRHNFCTTCIHSYVDSKISQGDLTGLLPCPVCSIQFKAPSDKDGINDWIQGLYLNYQLLVLMQEKNERKLLPCEPCEARCYDMCGKSQDLLDAIANFEPRDHNVSRGTCDSNEAESLAFDYACRHAAYFCRDCLEAYCVLCSEVHRSSRASMAHKLVPADSPDLGRNILGLNPEHNCTYHHNRAIEFYCNSHKEFVCSDCAIFTHRNCDSIEESSKVTENACVEDIIAEVELLIQKVRTHLDSIAKKVTAHDEKVKQKMKTFKEDIAKVRQTIQAKFDAYERFCDDILQEVDKKSREAKQNAENLITGTLAAIETDSKLFRAAINHGAASDISALCHSKKRGLERISQTLGIKIKLAAPQMSHKFSKEITRLLTVNYIDLIGKPTATLGYTLFNPLRLTKSDVVNCADNTEVCDE